MVTTLDDKSRTVKAIFDSGSFHTILREDRVPAGALIERRMKPLQFKTAAQGGTLNVTGGILLVITIGNKMIEDSALVSPDLSQEMLIGAGTMQKWDISVMNQNGKTEIIVGRDMRDPDIIEVD